MHPNTGRNGRQRPFEERTRQHDDYQAGGRSERHSQERDREQFRAGYQARDWERHPESYRNVRSEPHWDPSGGGFDEGARGYEQSRASDQGDYSLQGTSQRSGYSGSQRGYGARGEQQRGFAGERGAWGSRGYDQGLRDDRWRADDSFSEPSD
ncbi:MAG TPA: hypothetical protein VFZ61_14310, partial [Polyangiales bacterium]